MKKVAHPLYIYEISKVNNNIKNNTNESNNEGKKLY